MADSYLPYCRPTIGEDEIAEVVETLRSGWLTTGSRAQRFEAEFARATTSPHALAVNSGTSALHLALAAAGIGAGDEVITTPLTFCSCANVIVQQGAMPVLADISEVDLNIDPDQVQRHLTPRTRAIMAVDYAGQPCRLDQLREIADAGHLLLLEDAAHSAGAYYRDRPVGGIADATAFSFYPTKNMTTGEGGMLTSTSEEFDAAARVLALHGMSHDAWRRYGRGGSWSYEVTALGFKYNMNDIEAALGLVQLRRLPEFNARRDRLAARYDEGLRDCEAIVLPRARPEIRHTWHLYPIRLQLEQLGIDRAEFIEALAARGIGTSVHFIPIHHHAFYREGFGFSISDLPVTERVFPQLVSLPLYPLMSEADVDHVVEVVLGVLKAHRR